jgi:hypothetical protein
MIQNYDISFDDSVRSIGVTYDIYNEDGSYLTGGTNATKLKEFTIEKTGENKFFGFGICQKLNIKLIDQYKAMHLTTDHYIRIRYKSGIYSYILHPLFYVTENHRNENNNELSITAYDAIYKAGKHNVNELVLSVPYALLDFAQSVANFLGVGLLIAPETLNSFSLSYDNGANFEGSETIREALNAIAEATQTIYYIDNNNNLVFKRLDINGDSVFSIDKSKYITLESGENRRLATIVNATELGDNVSVSTSAIGSTQYVRDNPFWELREDIATLLDAALINIGGLTINQFSCNWRGNPLLEIGDKISLTTKDNNTVISYLLNDTLFYDGSLSQDTQWFYDENDTETESNPNNIGDALKQTFARVDKVNKQIDLVVSQTEENKELLSSLQLTTDNITASVEKIESNVSTSIGSVNEELAELSSKVSASVTAEDLTIEVQTQLSNGVSSVTTSTGFVFNEEGLTVSKKGSEMETTITEDGMTVYRDEEAVLTANNIGVNATNLHATTYLIVGVNSRFEDFGDDRTGCFWIGGS